MKMARPAGIRIVDLRSITEEEEEEEPVVLRPRPHTDPKSLPECYVKLRRVEEELKLVGEVSAAKQGEVSLLPRGEETGANAGLGKNRNKPSIRNQNLMTGTGGGQFSKYTSCPKCQKTVIRNHLSRHLDTHSTDRRKEFKCEQCNTSFFRSDHWRRHMRIHSEEGAQFKCEPCNKLFFRRDKLLSHQRTKHS